MKRAWGRRWAWALLSGWALVAVPQGAVAGLLDGLKSFLGGGESAASESEPAPERLSAQEVKALFDKATQGDRAALAKLRKAAEQGDAVAQNGLGWMYAKGRGVAQDDAQAVRWYRKAAEQGDAVAQFNLGMMYEDGRGVPQDDAQAVAWYRKAAEQGDAVAQHNLGWMYENGRPPASE